VDFSSKYVLLIIFCLLFILAVFAFYYPLYPIFPSAFLAVFDLPGLFQWQTLATNMISILTAVIDLLIILAIAYGFGTKILTLIRAQIDGIEQFIFAVAVGFGLLSLLVFGLGLAEQLRYPVLFALLILGIFIGYQECRNLLFGFRKDKPKTKWTIPNLAIAIFILFVLLISFLCSLTPCTESDALRYHLAVPQFYLEKQGIYYDPYNAFSNFPFQIESLYTLGLSFAGTMLPKLISWSFFLLTALAIYSFTRQFFQKTNPLIPVAIFCATPFIPIISSWAFIESGLTFYVFMAIYALCLIAECGMRIAEDKTNPSALWIIFAILSGFLLGIKYSMVAVVFFLWLIALIYFEIRFSVFNFAISKSRVSDRNPQSAIKLIIFCLLLTILIAVPWFIKSYIYTGNPVYPLGYSVFDGADWNKVNAGYYTFHAQLKGWLNDATQKSLGFRIAELFWLPWQATMNPPVSPQHPVNFGDWQLGPIYLAFIPLLLLVLIMQYRKRKESRGEVSSPGSSVLLPSSLFLLAIGYYIFWSATYRDNRFLMPILPLLSILVARALSQLRIVYPEQSRRADCGLRSSKKGFLLPTSLILQSILWLMLIYNAVWMVQTVVIGHNPLSFILGRETKDQYRARNLDYYPTFQYLNQEVPEKDHVLFIGEYRALYCHRPYYCADYFDTPVILRIIQQSETIDQIKEKLAEMQVKYMLFNEKELGLYFPYFKQRFQSLAQFQLFQSFISDPSLIPVYTDPRGMTVFKF
jgi:hypothetical protein